MKTIMKFYFFPFFLFTFFSFLPIAFGAEGKEANEQRQFKKIIKNVTVEAGMDVAGPLYFKDTPDNRLESLHVFQYGGHFNFLFGSSPLDEQRLGIGFFYAPTASSENRNISFIAPYLLYETGRNWILQLEAGYNLTQSSKDLENNYEGIYLGSSLSHVFLKPSPTRSWGLSLGIRARVVVHPEKPEYSSAFVGGGLEISYQTVKP